jgi:fatty acid desaturase
MKKAGAKPAFFFSVSTAPHSVDLGPCGAHPIPSVSQWVASTAMATTIGEAVSEEADAARRLGSLTRRSDGAGMAQLAGHLALLAVTAYFVGISIGTYWLVIALPAYGFVMVFLFAPLHETIHRTAFRSRWINSAVGWVCGAVLMLPPNYFRAFHFTHHRYTQDPERDPELRYPKPSSWRSYLWTLSGIPYWRERMTTTWQLAMGRVTSPFITAPARDAIVREARILLGVYGLLVVYALAAESAAPIFFWLLPVVLGQPFLRMYLLAEHTGCPLVADMRVNTRTTLTNRALRRLAWNMPFHTAHHIYPGVPFHALPQVHERIRDSVRYQAPGYLAVHRALISTFPRPARGAGSL